MHCWLFIIISSFETLIGMYAYYFRFGVDMSKFPLIKKVNDALVKLPAFIAGDAFRQPDTPEDMRVN